MSAWPCARRPRRHVCPRSPKGEIGPLCRIAGICPSDGENRHVGLGDAACAEIRHSQDDNLACAAAKISFETFCEAGRLLPRRRLTRIHHVVDPFVYCVVGRLFAWGARLRRANRSAHRVPTCLAAISVAAGTIVTMSAPPTRSMITRSLVLILNQSRKCIALARPRRITLPVED